MRWISSFVLAACLGSPTHVWAATPPGAPPVPDTPLEVGQVEEARSVLGRVCSVRIGAVDAGAGRIATGKALAEITRILKRFSTSDRYSEVYSINVNADQNEVVVGDEVHALLQRSLDLCRLTGGAYDPTVATWDYLWNFDLEPFVRPLSEELAARRPIAGCKNLVIKPNRTVRVMKLGLRVSLAAVATGFALERAAHVLRESDVQNFRIQVGTAVYVQGRIGTRHWYATAPNTRHRGEAVAQLYLSSHAAVTRSDSDRVVFRGSHRYHEVLDTRTGLPAEGVIQVTVLATDPTLADGLAWAAMVLGPRSGLDFLEKQKNVEGFLVDRTGKIRATSGMRDLARLPPKMDIL